MPVVDPSGIQISVILTTERGREYPLWIGGATSGTGPDAQSIFLDTDTDFQDLPIVTGVNIEMGEGLVPSTTVELSAPYELGLKLLESELFIIGNALVVQVGYPRIGLFLPPIATMSCKPSISINPDEGLTATLNGRGGVFAGSRARANRRYENVSGRDVMEQVGNLAHNRWLFVFPEQQPGASGEDPLYVQRNITQSNETDWSFVNRIARRAGCSLVVRPLPNEGARNRIVVVRRSESASADPIYTLTSRGQIDMIAPNGRFPLLSFESEAEQVWLGAGSDRVSTNDVNSETGEVPDRTEVTADDIEDDIQPPTDGAVGSGSSDTDDINIAARASRDDADDMNLSLPSNDSGRTPAEGARQEADEQGERGGGIQATATTIGNPLAFPGDRIRVENLGPFSGNYRIISISHQIGEGDWTTTLRLIRGGPFGEQWITEALRRRLERDPADQQPTDQPELGQDAASGGSTVVEPVGDA